jgi:hypothetical protein
VRFLKGRIPAAIISAAVVAGIVAAATVAVGSISPAVAFAQAGHWVFNRSESAVAHVDSGTRAVDARVAVPGTSDDAVFAVQGPSKVFLSDAGTSPSSESPRSPSRPRFRVVRTSCPSGSRLSEAPISSMMLTPLHGHRGEET